jgi:16S rRNA (adenine1518-N6/adenine1519-N6)-dimethyltransferase
MVRPKKSLGQHFLTDQTIAKRITDLLEAENIKTVIEIGPGKGILTRHLMDRSRFSFFQVEIDRESVDYLVELYPGLGETLILGDFLKIDMTQFGDRLAIIGNFPYNISSQIFFRVLENRNNVDEVVCMIQKEVADRLASGPGTKRYGILSVLLQAWYDIHQVFTVQPGSFFPAPEVKSSVIRLVRNNRKELGCDEQLFFRIVKMAFNQRRKMMRNSLSGIMGTLSREEAILTRRPEQLSVEEFIELTNMISGEL